MQKATHINVGLTTSLTLLIQTLSFNPLYAFYVIIALIQDWDHSQGTLARKLGISLPFKHRGFTHTLLFILIMQGLINALFYFGLGVEIKVVDQIVLFVLLHAHLLADIWTVSGFPYLYPFVKRNIKIPGISIFRTGTEGEYFFNLVISGINIFLLYWIFSKGIIQKLIPSVEETQNIITSNPYVLGISLFLFLLFGIHIVSSELKRMKKDTIKLGKTLIKVFLSLILTTISIGVISFLIHNFIFPESNMLYFLAGDFFIVGISAFMLLKSHLEFLSKSLGYLINFMTLTGFFILTFNVFGLSNYLLKLL